MTWHLTVHPDNDPNGASLGIVDEFTELTYRHAVRGEGKGTVKINRYHPQAALLQQARYCRVHTDAGVVGAFWLLEGPVGLSSDDEEGGEDIEWSGSGALHYLDRAKMTNTSRITGGHDPVEGRWALHDQGPLAGNKNAHPIPMLRRVIAESLLVPGDPLNELTFDFTYTHDSANEEVPFVDGEFYANVGESARDLALRFTELGLIVQMTADLELQAFMEFGEDLSGAFGPSTVRFEKGVNIAAPIERRFDEDVQKTHLMVGGMDHTYIEVVNPTYAGGKARWGWLSFPETADEGALTAAALESFKARERASDVFSFPLPDHGADPSNGIYEPGPSGHFWVGNLVSLHTGTDTYDVDEHAVEVAAITWTTRDGDDYDVIVELGHTFYWSDRPAWHDPFIGGVPGSQHHLELCQRGSLATVEASCPVDGNEASLTAVATPNGDFETGDGTNWGGAVVVAGDPEGVGGSWFSSVNTLSPQWAYEFWNNTSVLFKAGQRYVFRFWNGGANTPNYAHVGDIASGDFVTQQLVFGQVNCVEWTPSADRTGVRFFQNKNPDGIGGASSGQMSIDNLRCYTGSGGFNPNDGHPDLVGTSPLAARCDHRHDVHRDTAPTVNDDWATAGYKLGTIWAQLDSLTTPTSMVGVWMLVDNSEGAAVWLPMGSGMANPMTTAGDIIKGGSGGDPERLGIGANGQILKVVSGSPAWAAESGGGGITSWRAFATDDQLHSPSPTSDTLVNDLSVNFSLDATTLVMVHWEVHFTRASASGNNRFRILDDATVLLPANDAGGGAAGYWLGTIMETRYRAHGMLLASLGAGEHTIKVVFQTVANTNATTFRDRALVVLKLA